MFNNNNNKIWFWRKVKPVLVHNLVKTDDYSERSEVEDYSDICRLCGANLAAYETFDKHQDSYIRFENCNVCFHNNFQLV